jgi:hypothetical protein
MKLSTALAIELGGGRAAYLTSILVSNTIEKNLRTLDNWCFLCPVEYGSKQSREDSSMRDVSEVHERLFREGNLEGNRDGGNRQIDDRQCPRGSSKKEPSKRANKD